jgi:hypothetical protein
MSAVGRLCRSAHQHDVRADVTDQRRCITARSGGASRLVEVVSRTVVDATVGLHRGHVPYERLFYSTLLSTTTWEFSTDRRRFDLQSRGQEA